MSDARSGVTSESATAVESAPAAPRRRARRALFALVLLALVWTGVELLAFAAHWFIAGEAFSFSAVARARQTAMGRLVTEPGEEQPTALAGGFFGVVPHPYLGYVVDPDVSIGGGSSINEHGFPSEDGPLVKRDPDTVIIGIFGGSVAELFYKLGRAPLADALRAHPALRDKRIRVLGFALGGFKQPQHLLALSYVLGLGGELDVAICIDGFNEVALPPSENVPAGLHTVYPRGWNFLADARIDPHERRAMGQLEATRTERRELAELAGVAPLRWSVLAGVVWSVIDRRLAHTVTEQQARLQLMGEGARPFSATGPMQHFDDEDAMYATLVQTWKDGALQMDRLCRANGIRMFSFLQPNQYVAGSKPLTAREERAAYSATSRFREPVERGYPLLQAAGAELAAAGVRFADLTQVFAGNEADLYVDTCCHFNAAGNAILAQVIGPAVASTFDGEGGGGGTLQRLIPRVDSLALTAPLEQAQIEIDGEFDDGSTRGVTYARVVYQSSDPRVAQVTDLGVVEARAQGRAQITAARDGHTTTVDVEVTYPSITSYGVPLPRRGAATLVGEINAAGDTVLTLRPVAEGGAVTLVVGVTPDNLRFCDTRLFVPLLETVHVPMPIENGVGTLAVETVPAMLGRTSYWQALVRDPRSACDWWGSNGVAVTLPN